jgi:hypothetical protein
MHINVKHVGPLYQNDADPAAQHWLYLKVHFVVNSEKLFSLFPQRYSHGCRFFSFQS